MFSACCTVQNYLLLLLRLIIILPFQQLFHDNLVCDYSNIPISAWFALWKFVQDYAEFIDCLKRVHSRAGFYQKALSKGTAAPPGILDSWNRSLESQSSGYGPEQKFI